MDKKSLLVEDYKKSFKNLENALSSTHESDLEKAGCIKYFEFCFELAWKSIKIIAEDMGIMDCNSPKASLKAAFANKWIDNEEVWLDMLNSRNLMAHTYNAATALKIYKNLKSYLPELKKLIEKLTLIIND